VTEPARGPVFFDPTGRRRKAVNRFGTALGLALGVASTIFLISVLAVPLLPKAPGTAGNGGGTARGVSRREARLSRHLAHRSRLALFREIERTRREPGPPPAACRRHRNPSSRRST